MAATTFETIAVSVTAIGITAAKRLGNKKTPEARMAEGAPDPLAGGIETLNASKNVDLEIEAEGGGRVMEEYRGLIEAYFKRLSEEE